MDELDNDALPLLLLLDDELFPQLLEWSASKGWSDLVIFLLETDYLRFKTNDIFEADFDSLTLYEPFHLIEKNSEGCFDKFFTPEKIDAMKRLLHSGIPLKSVYSQVCADVWKEMLRRGNLIIHSTFWPSVRRCIVQNHEIKLEDMLDDESKRQYFDRYIQDNASDLASLQCLLSVRRVLKEVGRYKVDPDFPEKHTAFSTAHPIGMTHSGTTAGLNMFGYFLGRSTDDASPSIMNRWRASKNAVVSASKALQAPFAGHNATASGAGGNVNSPQHSHDYSDPFEAFKILLEGTRHLQKQFFPTSANLSTGPGSAFATQTTVSGTTNGFLYGGASRRGSVGMNSSSSTSSDAGDSSSTASSPRAGAKSAASPQNCSGGHQAHYINGHSGVSSTLRNCSGISEALRIEIQSTLAINASVRAREIETVDRAFAFACAHMLEKLLLALEQEMLAYISAIFTSFEDTNDYALMVAHARALKCKRVSDYVSKLEFLYDRVRQQRIVSWKDAHTRGKVFIAYEHISAEGEDASTDGIGATEAEKVADSALSSNLDIGNNDAGIPGNALRPEGDHTGTGPFKPNVVAISLEIVIPHTTLLSPATVGSCTHRVSLYAGGRRRAARLKPKPESSGSVVTAGLVEASCALNSLGPLVDSSDNSILINDTASSSIEKADFSPRSALLARSDSNSSPKSPMRRLSSVKFQLSAPPAPILVPEPEPQSTEVEESGARQGGQEECKENKIARSYSIDSEHDFGDGDTLSELPALGIAGSIKHRNILGVGDVGMGGSECLDDILNANNSTNNNNYSSGSGMFSSASGKQLIDGYVEDEMDEDGDGGSDDSYSLGSDSSSDYEGDVRQVNSTGDLDQLMLRSISDIGGDDISLRNVGGGKGGGGGKYSRKHSAGNYMMSRTASNASVITTATGASTLPSAAGQNEGIRGYDDGTCRLAAIDTAKLDRLLYRDVLGSAQTLTRPMLAGSTDKPVDKVTAGGKVAKKITAKQLTASLTVALASSLCGEEHFGKKFAVPVQESFTFTTDSRGIELLNDLLYSKKAAWFGRDNTEAYVQAFEKVSSVFRQNSLLDTTRPVFRVCVQIESSVVTAAEAVQLKQQLAALQVDAAGRAGANVSGNSRTADGPPKAPLHPGKHAAHGAPSIVSRIAHSHIRIGLSYTLLTPTHTMLNTLYTVAAAACSALSFRQDATSDLLDSRGNLAVESKGDGDDNLAVAPLPLKLRYQDYFSEFSSALRTSAVPVIPGTTLPESLYELYLGTDPGLGTSPKQEQRKGRTASKSLCEPITRHVGLCDFAMSEVVAALSPRLVMQILMLVLVDRPVMLLSTSSTLLSKVQAMIPRLIWPFRVDRTHVVRQILNGAELHRFVYRHDVPFVSETQQPVIREKKLNRKTSSWREMITRFATNVSSTLSTTTRSGSGGPAENLNASSNTLNHRSPRLSVPRHRKSGSSSDLLAGILRRTASGAALAGSPTQGASCSSDDGEVRTMSGSNSPINLLIDIPSRPTTDSPPRADRSPFARIITPPSLQLPPQASFKCGGVDCSSGSGDEGDVQIDHHSCILGVDSNAYYTAATELRDELESLRIRGSAFTIIDIDSGIILNRRPDDFDEEDGEVPPKPLPSRLSDPEIFRCANFGVLRSLIKSTTLINEDLQTFTKAQFKPVVDEFNGQVSAPDPQLIAALMAEKIVMSNRELEKAFYAFWSEMVLRSLPKTIQHFPGPKVISCDVRAMLTELLHTVVASSASMDMGEDAEDLQLTPGSFSDSKQGSMRSMNSTNSSSGDREYMTGRAAYSTKAMLCAAKQLPAVTPSAQMVEHMNRMPFEEFLAMFVEQVATHGETNMCYAFYKEFIADGSVVFKDLLTRHSAVLNRWAM